MPRSATARPGQHLPGQVPFGCPGRLAAQVVHQVRQCQMRIEPVLARIGAPHSAQDARLGPPSRTRTGCPLSSSACSGIASDRTGRVWHLPGPAGLPTA